MSTRGSDPGRQSVGLYLSIAFAVAMLAIAVVLIRAGFTDGLVG